MMGDSAAATPGFASVRERRLWMAAAVVAAAIYSTLALAGSLAALATNQTAIDMVFAFGALVVLVAVATVGLSHRASHAAIGLALGVAATGVLALARMGTAAERTHLLEYGVLALLVYAALTERAAHGRYAPRPALTAIAATAAIGVVDELIQALLPRRVFDPLDILFNVAAALMAVTVTALLHGRFRRLTPGAHQR